MASVLPDMACTRRGRYSAHHFPAKWSGWLIVVVLAVVAVRAQDGETFSIPDSIWNSTFWSTVSTRVEHGRRLAKQRTVAQTGPTHLREVRTSWPMNRSASGRGIVNVCL